MSLKSKVQGPKCSGGSSKRNLTARGDNVCRNCGALTRRCYKTTRWNASSLAEEFY